ncbi:MAG: hypothetical protein HYX78_02055 [Armatimonadetes bacterium]|nr:hypothetical protein [Armatimonadota bacterium]
MLSRLSGDFGVSSLDNSLADRLKVVKRLGLLLFFVLLSSGPVTGSALWPGQRIWAVGQDNSSFGFGAFGRAEDGFDYMDTLAVVLPSGWIGGSYHVNGVDAWNGPTGFFSADIREQLQPGQRKTWLVYFWATPSASNTDLILHWVDGLSPYDPLVLARLEYIQKPQGVTGAPDVGTIWTSPPTDMILPLYRTVDGLTGHGFKLTFTLIPETPSLICLAFSVLTAVEFLMRRRPSG